MSTERAIFAGGCFWCMVEPFEERPGILAVTSGYTGGHIEYPTYDQVLSKASGHTEAVEILFDNELISYDELLDIYWSLIDPTDADGQIYDRGANYRPVIFVESEEQKTAAKKSKIALEKSGIWDKPIVVPIEEAKTFWPAEEYHQQYYKKDPKRYQAMHKARERYLALQRFKGKFKFLRKTLDKLVFYFIFGQSFPNHSWYRSSTILTVVIVISGESFSLFFLPLLISSAISSIS
ncbi:methionine sulfoxide reductase A [Lactococcus cremoris subsp. cremoris TIFN7]|nr:methionine sulfoxide reductase A [Lactococcus cremoris subsp. cremoris TIFN7]